MKLKFTLSCGLSLKKEEIIELEINETLDNHTKQEIIEEAYQDWSRWHDTHRQ